MKLELDRKDLISLAKGMNPNYRVMDISLVKNNGRMGGPHGDQWSWKWNAFDDLSDLEIYGIYLICKKSWDEESDEEIKERLRKKYSGPYPDDPSKITIAHIMTKEFPDVEYEILRDPEEPYMYSMRVNQLPEKVERAILERVPANLGVTVTEF